MPEFATLDEALQEIHSLRKYASDQMDHLSKLARIGIALSSTQKLDELFEMVVDEARAFTESDGGTLYLVSDDETELRFSVVQTESLGLKLGGNTGKPVPWPAVPLIRDGVPNMANVCAYVANTKKSVEIPDVYDFEGFDFTGTKNSDVRNNYRCRSMLVVPMLNHEREIIGVLQLINSRDPETGDVIPFAKEFLEHTSALASQAAVAISNARLIRDVQNLFDSFILAIASAIDEKSPYTGGHITRVANLTMEIANLMNATTDGHYAETHFNEDELYELRLAAWLHDTGKITTPEYVVDKRTKLETIFDRMELVRMRFELAKAEAKIKALESTAGSGATDADQEISRLDETFAFVNSCNETQEFVPDPIIERLEGIAKEEITTAKGVEPMLTPNELMNLEIRKGNLTNDERKIIENHAAMTLKILNKLPFPKKIKNVPQIAAAHHEKISGKGYPLGLKGDQIGLQARIMALADVFEALTAHDRPYKKAKRMTEVVKILESCVKFEELDGDVVKFFLEHKMHIDYAKAHLMPEQLDLE